MGNPQEMMQEAVEELCAGYERHTQYAAQIERMSNQMFVDQQWDNLVVDLIGPRPLNMDHSLTPQGFHNQLTRWVNTRKDLNSRFYNDEDITGVRNTRWGALMAVQAWEQKDKALKGIKSSDQRTRRHQANKRGCARTGNQSDLDVEASSLINSYK